MDITLILKHFELIPVPSMFGEHWFIRRVLTEEKLALYAALRVRGFTALDSFVTAFGEVVIGRAEHLIEAARNLELSALYAMEYEALLEALGPENLRSELAARAEEIAGYTSMVAKAIKIPPRESLYRKEYVNQSDDAEYSAALQDQLAVQQAREKQERVDTSAATQLAREHRAAEFARERRFCPGMEEQEPVRYE